MPTIKIHPLSKPIQAEITIPGSLSYTIRALNIAAMIKGSIKIINPLKSDDTYAMFTILKTLGIAIEDGENYFLVHGDITNVEDTLHELDVNISGRTARFILPLLCLVPGIKILKSHDSFKKRPIGDLVDGLRQIGAKIEYLEKEGYLPIKIVSNSLQPGKIKMLGSNSSQYFSAIIMVAPLIGELDIEVLGEQVSKSFIDVTIAIMHIFGVDVINQNYQKYSIKNGQKYKNIHTYEIETYATSASYFFGIAAVTGSKIKVLNLNPNSVQEDIHFVDILKDMGCIVEKNDEEKWISVTGIDRLKSIDIDMNHMPDTVPTLAVVASFAKGITEITGIEHLQIKESNRLEAPKNELQKMGIQATAAHDSLQIQGGSPHGAEIDTYGDHRIAMAFAVAGTRINGIEIKDPEVVNKSFPNFWQKLEKLGIKIERLSI